MDVYIKHDLMSLDRKWINSLIIDKVKYSTRAGKLWQSIVYRANPNGKFQEKHPSYIGTQNLFACFQEFAEWCQQQKGYMSVETNGRFWSLDKDIIFPSLKAYSPETCRFVPYDINCLFNTNGIQREDLPIGVSFHKASGKYASEISLGKKRQYLGLYETEIEAHQVWKESKISQINSVIAEYKNQVCQDIVIRLKEEVFKLQSTNLYYGLKQS
ncbi:MAG: hypothetical protein M0R77_08055 [Gammaproteobacteria bacterium]|nr:hypothetical protein [Gammaproteobacteria bacterium]